jgi:hypothetical protein
MMYVTLGAVLQPVSQFFKRCAVIQITLGLQRQVGPLASGPSARPSYGALTGCYERIIADRRDIAHDPAGRAGGGAAPNRRRC